MKYYIIAGEASGDLHASNLMKALKQYDSEAVFRGFGGDLMAAQGMELVKHYREMDFMGFVKVALNLHSVLKNISLCKKDILAFQPDVVILIDYPGFNLRIAKFLKQQGIRNFYYISPQIWAWKQSRVKQIKRNIDRMFVILPFEQEFYQKFDYEVDFAGHPLLDALDSKPSNFNKIRFCEEQHLPIDQSIIALLPGSRKQEIKTMLSVMTMLQTDFPSCQFVIAGVASIDLKFYRKYIKGVDIPVLTGVTHDLLRSSDAALVTSGTASLETALLKIPEIICYKSDYVSYLIARHLIKVNFIGLPNLIMNRSIVTELIQNDFNRNKLKTTLNDILYNKEYRQKMVSDYDALVQKLSGTGASKRVAEMMWKRLQTQAEPHHTSE
jgi:lipid-A-disaccharide synthase